MEAADDFIPTKEDLQRIAELTGMELIMDEADEDNEDEEDFDESLADEDVIYSPESIKKLLIEMTDAAFSTTADNDHFYYYWSENRDQIRNAARQDASVNEMLVLCFKAAIAAGSALSMNCLGALYYMGEVVEQDYKKAAELYKMAMDRGCYQSIINLGYIYEYGRIGKPDYAKAYQYYSLAAALAPSSEAAYKLGDMFSRGKAIPKDMSSAHALYVRSFELAHDDIEIAQPAFRIAKMLIDPKGPSYGVENDPIEALSLFQRAEIGLRKDIADGQYYYKKRLQEAIEGQEKARSMIESGGYDVIRDF